MAGVGVDLGSAPRSLRLGAASVRVEAASTPLPRERVAGIDLPALEPGRQPLLAHRGRAVGETVGHGIAAGGGLQTVVADSSRGGERFLEVVLGELPVLVGVVGEDAGEAIEVTLYSTPICILTDRRCMASCLVVR